MRTSTRRLGAALAAVVVTTAVAREASAFCRTTTCTKDCPIDENGCNTTGFDLYWASSCVSFGVQQDGSKLRGIDYAHALATVSAGFLSWMHADCGGGENPSVVLDDLGRIECSKQQYNQDQPNANIWMFRDAEWPYADTGATLALTTITFNVDDGEIFDADVEINSFDNPLTLGDSNVQFDLLSIVTHESGHFLGLAHTRDAGATMFASYKPGDTSLRSLEVDDVTGICTVYPPTRSAPCSPEPRHRFSPTCEPASDDKGCCTTAPGRPAPGQGSAVLALAAACLSFAARRRSLARRGRRW